MDLQAIYAALASTLSPNQQERQAAEAALKGWEGQPGYVSSLFRVVNSQEVAVEVRQAGIVYFKNIISNLFYWFIRLNTDWVKRIKQYILCNIFRARNMC